MGETMDDDLEEPKKNANQSSLEHKNNINSFKSDNHELSALYTKTGEDSPTERVKFNLSDDDSICSDEVLPPIPDGGWGWVIVVSSFLVTAAADGLAFSFGLLHQEFTNYFETTHSKTAVIGSLYIAVPLISGPIMSALVDRYGCRVMTIIAGIVCTIGFLLSSICNSIAMLCLTLGIISGLATGVMLVTAVVCVAFWFDKRRNFAVSLASCGMGFGTLVFSPLTHYLLEVYDWRNTVVLLSGFMLNMCVCGALMKDPEWLEVKQRRDRRLSKSRSRKSSSAGSMSSRSIGAESAYLDAEELKCLMESGKSPEYILSTLVSSIAEAEQLEATTQMNAEQTCKRMHSAVHLPTFIAQNEKVPPEVIEKLMSNKRFYNIILQNYPDFMLRRKSDVNLSTENNTVDKDITAVSVAVKVKKDPNDSKTDKKAADELKKDEVAKHEENNVKSNENLKEKAHHSNKGLHRTAAVQHNWLANLSRDHHYLKDMPLYRNTIMHRGAMLNIPRYKLRASSLPDMYRNSNLSLDSYSDDELRWHHRFAETLKKMFNYRMFTELHFLLFNLSSVILACWFIVPYFFLNSFMTARGVEGGEKMISIIGIASSIGIVALGWAGDQPWINVTKTYTLCLVICGASVAVYPLIITDFWLLAANSTVFGVSFASSYSYTATILMELMPIDQFTVAYGLILLSQGVGHLAGPPIGGMLYDLTGAWDLTFYIAGVWLVISGLLIGVIAYTNDRRVCGTAPLMKEEANEAEDEDSVAV